MPSRSDEVGTLQTPTISSISPSCGPVAGGNTVTLTGTDLTATTSVVVGSTSASFTVVSATQVVLVMPPGTPGCVCVVVTTPSGTASVCYTYGCPTPAVTSLCPSEGPICGGTKVTVIGSNLTGATAATFGGKPGTGLVVDPSGCSLTVTAPSRSPGTYDVRVTTPSGLTPISPGDKFTYRCPVLYEICEPCGPLAGGDTVCVTGVYLNCLTYVVFNNTVIPKSGLNVHSSGTYMTLTVPQGTAPGPVTVRGISLVSLFPQPIFCQTAPVTYTYHPAACPSAIGIFPPAGTFAGGTSFVIVGSNLYCATVRIGGVKVPVLVHASGTYLTGVTPPHAMGAVTVTVDRPCCPTVTIPGGFTYFRFGPPMPVDLVPSSGPVTGGSPFFIAGTDLFDATVTFGGVPAIDVTVDESGTLITGTVPAGSPGPVTVTVTNPEGSANLAEPYTYVDAPTLASISPTAGPEAGGTTVTITGTSLAGTTEVTFGDELAAFTVVNNNQLTAVTPPGTGVVSVTVTTDGGIFALEDVYTYVPPPEILAPEEQIA
ncbi:IPT/TIG domain-containing protein [Streptomyces pathocidini]|uniref:IPT/TIG domain-containing protein n=1 Tax=Streptomyces pathocidini TaxID=1650571 RepID=A0ABW7UKK4_9ACTN|nr:IPT/TIG domain-containing protein [Streptomyces pathocidini]